MRLHSLVAWYLPFSRLWVIGFFVLLSTLYTSLALRPRSCPLVGYWECVALVAYSHLEYALLFLASIIASSILWGYEFEAGYHYFTHHGGLRGLLVFSSKTVAVLTVVAVPYAIAKALALLVAGYPGLGGTVLGYLVVVARLLAYAGAYTLVGVSLAGSVAASTARTSYPIILWSIALITLEPPGTLEDGLIGLKSLNSGLFSLIVVGGGVPQVGLGKYVILYLPLALIILAESLRDKG